MENDQKVFPVSTYSPTNNPILPSFDQQPEELPPSNPSSNNNSNNNSSIHLTQDELRMAKTFMPPGFTLVSKARIRMTLSKAVQQSATTPVVVSQKALLPPTNNKQEQAPRPKPSNPQTSYGLSASAASLVKKTQKSFPQKKPKPNLPPEMLRWLRIVNILQKQRIAEPFLHPVDTTIITDYLTVIKQPMDLRTVQKNIIGSRYSAFTQFAVDLKKIWFNAYQYNPKGSELYKMAIEMETLMNKLLQQLNPQSFSSKNSQQSKIQKQVSPALPKNTAGNMPRKMPNLADIPMTLQQKRLLGQSIKKLPQQYLRGVWEIVSSCLENQNSLQFDIETLPVKKTRELEKYVKDAMIEVHEKKLLSQNPTVPSDEQSSFIISDEED